MGMYLSLAGVSDATIALIHADPPLIWQVASPDDPEAVARARTETWNIAAALGRVDDAELRRRFAPAEMMRLEIYPEIWDRDPANDDPLGYLLEMVGVLRGALERVVGHGHGLLVTLS
jgi:hypothetical protein